MASAAATPAEAVAAWERLPDPPAAPDPAVRDAVAASLRLPVPRVSQVFLYDDAGSELYEQITATPEYYLTSVELALLREHAAAIVGGEGRAEHPAVVVELGAGSGVKTLLLLEQLLLHIDHLIIHRRRLTHLVNRSP